MNYSTSRPSFFALKFLYFTVHCIAVVFVKGGRESSKGFFTSNCPQSVLFSRERSSTGSNDCFVVVLVVVLVVVSRERSSTGSNDCFVVLVVVLVVFYPLVI
jgi:hypothetical protein